MLVFLSSSEEVGAVCLHLTAPQISIRSFAYEEETLRSWRHGESWHIAPVSGRIPVSGDTEDCLEIFRGDQRTEHEMIGKHHFMVRQNIFLRMAKSDRLSRMRAPELTEQVFGKTSEEISLMSATRQVRKAAPVQGFRTARVVVR